MSGQVEEAELYLAFKTSPLLTETAKLILEAKGGISASEIALRLHKKAPTVHRALQKLRSLSLVTIGRKGRNMSYMVLPSKKHTVERILVLFYHPTKSFVIGELAHPSLNVSVKQNEEIKGMCFKHRIDIIYEYYEERSSVSGHELLGEHRVAINVLNKFSERDALSVVGTLFDLQAAKLDGYLLGVIEDGTSHQSFLKLKSLLDAMENKLDFPSDAVFIRKKASLAGIKEIRDLAVSMLNR